MTAGALLHLALALLIHLSPDEAHYALYALHLDWSYFDHPPLVGWVQWPALQLGGSDLAMRLVPMACWLVCAWQLHALAQRWWPAHTGLAAPGGQASVAHWALGLLLLAPLPHLLGLALVPDTLLMPISLATLGVTATLCDAGQARRRPPWLALGLCLGLAGLAKYTAVMLAAGALLALVLAHGWRLACLPGPWLTAVLALALVSPVFAWNAGHGWISFAYQLNHAGGGGHWQAWRPLAFAAVQLLVYGALPLAGLLLWWKAPAPAVCASPMRGLARPLSPGVLCACFGLPLLWLLLYLSGRGSTLPHWSAPGWVVLLPAAAAGLQRAWASARARLWLRAGLVWQAAGCVLMVVLLALGGWAGEHGAQAMAGPGEHVAEAPRNPVADLVGWDDAARQARALALREGVSMLAVVNWTLASRIAWYARPWPVQVIRRHDDQFDLWFAGLRPGDRVLWVDWSLMSFAPPVGPGRFVSCRPLAQQPVWRAGRQLAHFNFSLCEGWQGPAQPRPGASS